MVVGQLYIVHESVWRQSDSARIPVSRVERAFSACAHRPPATARFLEEAAKYDHRNVGKQQGLFMCPCRPQDHKFGRALQGRCF